ncbi:MAG TPA: thiamine pyrophosphate-dependent enzyme, partial [Thermoanaerobaculia bacterium]|nr:thiamine pyrophosphate-dependent enzyme [Thermoanaerobaculia bacterium]
MEPLAQPRTPPAGAKSTLAVRFGAFVAERFPFALDRALEAFRSVCPGEPDPFESAIDALRAPLARALESEFAEAATEGLPDTTPRVTAAQRLGFATAELVEACDGFLRREAIRASLTPDERVEILRGMILTRATDNRLKAFFSGGEVRYRGVQFQGKGFRSLGQEAIYASAVRLKRGPSYLSPDGSWRGDVVAPLIRDYGAALAMHPGPELVRMALNAQMGKSGPPMEGKDLHIGSFEWGILPPTAPLSISTMTIAGMAMAFARDGSGRVGVSYIGEGGTSLGEWHEAVNLCAARKLPAIFCVQNNQTALATPVADQSAVRVFAEKAAGYGIPGITIDGTDPDCVVSAFAWAAERAREGKGPTLIELVCMRICGHAHHDDMLYLGKEPPISWSYPSLTEPGYADRELYEFWSKRDPIPTYAARLEAEGVIRDGELDRMKAEAEILVEQEARGVIAAAWPEPNVAGRGVFAGEAPRRRVEVLDTGERKRRVETAPLVVEPAPPFDPNGKTFLEAVMLGVRDALGSDPRVFVYGEDVGGKYGNAFLLLRPLLPEFGGRILNSPLSEAAVLGVCVGAALAGQRPI